MCVKIIIKSKKKMLSLSDSILNLNKISKTVKYLQSLNHQHVLEEHLKQLDEDIQKEIENLTKILIDEQRSVD